GRGVVLCHTPDVATCTPGQTWQIAADNPGSPVRRHRPRRSSADRGIAQGNHGIGEACGVHRGTGRDQPASLQQVARPGHGQHRGQPLPRATRAVPGQPARRPVAGIRIPAPDQLVSAHVMPAVLDHPPELLRPEVGHRVVPLGAAQDVRGGHLRGVDGGIPVLNPDPAPEPAGPERGAVPRREDAAPAPATPRPPAAPVPSRPRPPPTHPPAGRPRTAVTPSSAASQPPPGNAMPPCSTDSTGWPSRRPTPAAEYQGTVRDPASAPSAPASGAGAASSTVTSQPFLAALVASLAPIQPAPTTASLSPGRPAHATPAP